MLTFLGSRGFGELTLCQLPFCQLPTLHPVGLISETEINRRSGRKGLQHVDVLNHHALLLHHTCNLGVISISFGTVILAKAGISRWSHKISITGEALFLFLELASITIVIAFRRDSRLRGKDGQVF
jgi:hypothetical protein